MIDQLHDRTQAACQSCNALTVEIGAAMDRIEELIIERDAAWARIKELEALCSAPT